MQECARHPWKQKSPGSPHTPAGETTDNAIPPTPSQDTPEARSEQMAMMQNTPIVFHGRVVDQDSKPLPDVEVSPVVHQSIGLIKQAAGGPEFVKCAAVRTNHDGLFTIKGYTGFSLSFGLRKEGYREWGGGACFDRGLPSFHHPDPDNPIEFVLIRSDIPSSEKILEKKYEFSWNRGPVILDLGASIGKISLEAFRERPDPNQVRNFAWNIKIQSLGFEIALIEGTNPAFRVAPQDGYVREYRAGARADERPWFGGINRTFAIRTNDNRFGTMDIQVDSHNDDGASALWVTMHLNQPGLRNINRK